MDSLESEFGQHLNDRYMQALRAEMPGWYGAKKFYLLPEAAFNTIAKYYKDQVNFFPVREVTLRKMLAESGRRTMMIRLDGSPRRVLVIKRNWIDAGNIE